MNYWVKRIGHLLSKKRLATSIAEHKHAKAIESQGKILPQVSIEEITDDSPPKLAEIEHADGNVSVKELECIAKLINFHQPSSIFEIGTFDGRTSLNMALNAPNAKIFTLDLPKTDIHKTAFRIKKGDQTFINKEQSGTRFIGTPQEAQITQIYADSANYDYSELNGTIDAVFIDGAHTYEYVLSDTETAFGLLRNGKGLLIWHDYEWKEVIHALNTFYRDDSRFKNLQHITGTTLVTLELS